MKAVVIAMLLLTAGFVVVAATPTASACSYTVGEPPSEIIACANPAIDLAQCILTGHNC